MAKALKDDFEPPKVGSCQGCGQWGPKFTFCQFCEDSGFLQDNDPNNSQDTPMDEEEDYEDIDDVEKPHYITDWIPHYISPLWDTFKNMDVEDLFDEVYEHLDTTTENKEAYRWQVGAQQTRC